MNESILRQYADRFRREARRLEEEVGKGNLEDMQSYKFVCGKISTLKECADRLEETAEEIEAM